MGIITSPPAIIFINTDLTDQVLGVFVSQFYITQVMDAASFDGYVAANPTWPVTVHLDGYRILVLRDLWDLTNRSLADIVLFAKGGLVTVECNNYGPPGATLTIARAYLTDLINLEKYHKYFHDHFAAHRYEQSWKGEPTNNDDFNPFHMDRHHNVEPRDE